tara:strand:- start:21 stop:575 length:555 start_codon:yes stop_codon:yes gene_type:complete
MGRAILIDDFLSESDFSSITEKVVESEYWSNDTLGDYLRDDLWDATTNLVFKRLKEINLFEEKFWRDKKNYNFSYNQFRPTNYHHNGNNGAHIDNGSYVFYIHPDWDEGWGGKLQLPNAQNGEHRSGIHAKPNRFIWMNPSVLHDITSTGTNALHARVTNLGFMNWCFDHDPSNCAYLNIFTTD